MGIPHLTGQTALMTGTETAMWRRGKCEDTIREALECGRIRLPDYMRDVVLYLARPASRAVNGKIIAPDPRDWLALQGDT